MYIRTVNIERDGEQYGTYYQAVRSYREAGKVKQDVVHLGEYATANEALIAWPHQIAELEKIGRPKKAAKLAGKLQKLRSIS